LSLFRGIIIALGIYFLVASMLPIIGYQIYLYGPLRVSTINLVAGELFFLVVIKSSSLMTMNFFILNYLRNRRPLSSVAPLLVFCNFIIGFGFVFFLIADGIRWTHWIYLLSLCILSLILYKENRKESTTIFKNEW